MSKQLGVAGIQGRGSDASCQRYVLLRGLRGSKGLEVAQHEAFAAQDELRYTRFAPQ